MAHVSLYRKYRPNVWENVVGQDHIVRTLINQIKTDTISHAYLFTGTRGTGKTSSAKIFARAVNCLEPVNGSPCGKCAACSGLASPSNMDVLEIDAASNNGVDEIRQLRENIQYPPTVGKYKVYIIDEVHMLSIAAFNALLKTLEEPPAHAIFILATTEVHKLPQTVLSRCMRFDFRLVPKVELVSLLKRIFDGENYPYEEGALEILAEHGEGSVRDTLSLADMCMSYAPDRLTAKGVDEVLGASDFRTLSGIAAALLAGDTTTLLSLTRTVYDRGKGIGTFNKELSSYLRSVLTVKNVTGYTAGKQGEELDVLKKLAETDNYRLGRALDLLCGAENALRYTTQPEILFDAILVRAAEMSTEDSVESLRSRLAKLEKELKELKESGIRIAPDAEMKQASAKPTGTPLSELPFAVTDEAPAFEEQQHDENKEQAQEIWSELLFELREQKHNLLFYGLKNQNDVKLEGTQIILRTTDGSTEDLLSRNESIQTINEILAKIQGGTYRFLFEQAESSSKKNTAAKTTLNELFGATLTEKK